jgi:UDP-glucose 4-epimerase
MGRYLITGGCGFIGSHLALSLLKSGHAVRVLDDLSSGKRENVSSNVELIVGSVTESARVASAMDGIDGCFHLAGIASVERGTQDWVGTHSVNLTGAITIFNAARRANGAPGIPVVYASSAAVYGDEATMPLSETSPARPLSAYGADKLGGEQHARVAGIVHNVPTVGLRLFNVYGPRQDPKSPYSGVISIFCNRVTAGEAITIFGDGKQSRDFVYIDDVIASLTAAMAKLADGKRAATAIYNVCTGRPTTVLDLARLIGELCGAAPQIAFVSPRADDIRVSLGSADRLRTDLGIECRTDLKDGLRLTLASLR